MPVAVPILSFSTQVGASTRANPVMKWPGSPAISAPRGEQWIIYRHFAALSAPPAADVELPGKKGCRTTTANALAVPAGASVSGALIEPQACRQPKGYEVGVAGPVRHEGEAQHRLVRHSLHVGG